jgi:hypothetical protein
VKLYRVFPYDPSAAPIAPGGVLFVPPPSALGRIANPLLYRELYYSDCPEGGISEVFGHLPVWTNGSFIHASGLQHHVSLFELDDAVAIFDLDNTASLAAIGISKPSFVITRRREITQDWAKTIYNLGAYAGARWWGYYSVAYFAFGLWDRTGLRHMGPPEPLSTTHPAVMNAARMIVRQIQ